MFTVGLTWFVNVFFYEKFFIIQKENRLLDVYNIINSNEDEAYSDDIYRKAERLCSIYNINFIVSDAESNVILTTIYDPNMFNGLLREFILDDERRTESRIIKTTDNYEISFVDDKYEEMQYLTMWGNLDNGNFFMLRTSLDGIKASVNFSNSFYGNVAILALLVGGLIMYFFARRFTKPITELSDLSERMANLDFNAKYQDHHFNEIDDLGENFNQMSEKLQEVIGQLKTSNLELQNDIEKKQKLEEMRLDFLSNVSHELKTPIAIIQGYAEGLKEGVNDDPESTQFYCDVIMDETQKMNELVKQLLNLSSLEYGASNISIERFNIVELVENSYQWANVLAKKSGAEVVLNKIDEAYVWADENLIEEVVRNYISNAIHYAMGAKKVSLDISKNEEYVKVSVFNTGNNIPEDMLDKIWDKFFKVDKARTREYGGSGIGLSIVKTIIEKHEGSYGVINKPDGVEFWFELKLA